MRQVIFIGSTSYSGSTFFDMILGNDPEGFSCGEVYAYFHPYRAHHIYPDCGCADSQCDFWPRVKNNGEERLYETIFDLKPEVRFIVDSSKDPFWISAQSRNLKQQGIATKNILIWKTPAELAQSYKKRDILNEWEQSWINYHRIYYSLIKNWQSVRYADFIQKEGALEKICAYLEIPYFQDKEKYWQKRIISYSATIPPRSISKMETGAKICQEPKKGEQERQQIYYNPVTDTDLLDVIAGREERSPIIMQIRELLQARDLFLNEPAMREFPDIKFRATEIQLRNLKQKLVYASGRLRFRG